MYFLILVLSVVAVVQSGPVQHETEFRSLVGNFVECANSDLSLCLKENALKVTEKLRAVREFKLFNGVTLFNNEPKEAKSLEPLSSEPDVRNKQLTARLWESTSDLLHTGELELSYDGIEDEEESRDLGDVEESRGKLGGKKKKKKVGKKKLKMLMPLFFLLKAKAVGMIIITLIISAISLLKLAIIAKLAFIIKLIAIIKALLDKKHAHKETWEPAHGWDPHSEHNHVEHGHIEHAHIEHPQIEHGHIEHGWEGGWPRSGNDANNLAYSAYAN